MQVENTKQQSGVKVVKEAVKCAVARLEGNVEGSLEYLAGLEPVIRLLATALVHWRGMRDTFTPRR